MKRTTPLILTASLAFAMAFIFSCSTDDSDPPPSGEASFDYCITASGCLPGPFTASTCNGQLSNGCPNNGGGTSSGITTDGSSSSVGGGISSSNPPTPTHSLDGVWADGDERITVSGNGNTGVFSAFSSDPIYADAVNKNHIKLGDLAWRNIASTGNLTWSGQVVGITFNSSSPNIATGIAWTNNGTFTMSSNGQTLTFAGSNPATGANFTRTWTRKQ